MAWCDVVEPRTLRECRIALGQSQPFVDSGASSRVGLFQEDRRRPNLLEDDHGNRSSHHLRQSQHDSKHSLLALRRSQCVACECPHVAEP